VNDVPLPLIDPIDTGSSVAGRLVVSVVLPPTGTVVADAVIVSAVVANTRSSTVAETAVFSVLVALMM
jgi:hypothetical protein